MDTYKIKKYLTLPYNAVKSSILCIRFPFLYPRNTWSGKHYSNWKLEEYYCHNYNNAYSYDTESNKINCINKWWAFKINCANFINKYILQIFHCIPTYTIYEWIPFGWRKTFGIQMCKEIKRALIDNGGRKKLRNYRINDIKEKYGSLRWYDLNGCEEVNKIINKYEYISLRTCISCGKTADYVTQGWIEPYCKDCIDDNLKKKADEYFYDMDFYGWTKARTIKEEKNTEE